MEEAKSDWQGTNRLAERTCCETVSSSTRRWSATTSATARSEVASSKASSARAACFQAEQALRRRPHVRTDNTASAQNHECSYYCMPCAEGQSPVWC